jgi:enoyl-CoA hydratase/carnithine racemase
MIIASPNASFGLPEAQVGLYAAAGGLPRLVRNVGLQIASEIALTCRRLSAQEALGLRLINAVSRTPDSVVEEAVAAATRIASVSPDAVVVTRQGILEAWESASVERATTRTAEEYMEKLVEADNFRIGVTAFANKKKPEWVPSKLWWLLVSFCILRMDLYSPELCLRCIFNDGWKEPTYEQIDEQGTDFP